LNFCGTLLQNWSIWCFFGVVFPRRSCQFPIIINGQQFELRTAYKVDRGRLVCEVFVGSRNLVEFFPEYLKLYEIKTYNIRRVNYV